MIYIGKSPYRVSLLGGSSDLDWFVKKEKFGICLGYSLDRYSYSVLNTEENVLINLKKTIFQSNIKLKTL